MAKIIPLPQRQTSKFGYKRAKKNKCKDLEDKGQLNLFMEEVRILELPSTLSPFDYALKLDDEGDPKAMDAYLKAIERGDCIADAYCNLGIIESRVGSVKKAFGSFTNALKLEPRHFEAQYNLANLYFEEGDLKLAKLHYELALEIEPSFPNAYFNLGLVYATGGNYDDAIECLITYKKLSPDNESKKANDLLISLRKSIRKTK